MNFHLRHSWAESANDVKTSSAIQWLSINLVYWLSNKPLKTQQWLPMYQRIVELTMGWWLFLVYLPMPSTINYFAMLPNGCPETIFSVSCVMTVFGVLLPPSPPRCELIPPTFTSYLDYVRGSVLCDIIIFCPDLLLVGPQPSFTKVLLAFIWGENLQESVKVLSQSLS